MLKRREGDDLWELSLSLLLDEPSADLLPLCLFFPLYYLLIVYSLLYAFKYPVICNKSSKETNSPSILFVTLSRKLSPSLTLLS